MGQNNEVIYHQPIESIALKIKQFAQQAALLLILSRSMHRRYVLLLKQAALFSTHLKNDKCYY
ncbi:hypothetical protein AXY04_09090 [Enterobacter asburiae]|nr:hypothetical protein AXY04_09090 [Enterobacter asburiae]